jgi:hypothetical protein
MICMLKPFSLVEKFNAGNHWITNVGVTSSRVRHKSVAFTCDEISTTGYWRRETKIPSKRR